MSDTCAGDETAFKKVMKARVDLVTEHPFFASLALRLKVKADHSCRTAWTDGRVFAYNPSYVKILTSEKIKGLCAHTVMHPACAHHKRRNGRDAATWNKACDYAINPILLDAGITLPDGFLYEEAYAGKTADHVYEILSRGEGENSEQGRSHEQEAENTESGEPSSDVSDKETAASVDTDNTDDASDGFADPGLSGEVRDADAGDMTGDDPESETDWHQAMVQAAAGARRMGKLPRGIKRFVDAVTHPRLCWRQLLARFIERNARSDYTWLVPNKRFIHQDLYFPSLNNHQLNEIAVAIDTSGSIRNDELIQFGAELSAIMEAYPTRIYLLYCDMTVTGYHVIDKWDLPIRLKPVGGGGTDFRPAFEFLNREGVSPSCLVYLTDLECRHFPSKRPDYPVLWVCTGDTNKKEPPFGRVIHLDLSRTTHDAGG